jgi:hypothetical protein
VTIAKWILTAFSAVIVRITTVSVLGTARAVFITIAGSPVTTAFAIYRSSGTVTPRATRPARASTRPEIILASDSTVVATSTARQSQFSVAMRVAQTYHHPYLLQHSPLEHIYPLRPPHDPSLLTSLPPECPGCASGPARTLLESVVMAETIHNKRTMMCI